MNKQYCSRTCWRRVLPEFPLTGVQRMFGEQAMKAPTTCKPETKDGMRVLRWGHPNLDDMSDRRGTQPRWRRRVYGG